MHLLLALTLMHDRSLSLLTTPLNSKEAFHWYHGVRMFSAKLAGDVNVLERDALWAAAMCLSFVSFFYVEGDTAREAWPLKQPSNMDLGWLKMIDGKKEVWRVAGPPTKDHVFEKSYPVNIQSHLPPSMDDEIGNLPPEFFILYNLQQQSDTSNNPYYHAVTLLARLFTVDDMFTVLVGFLTFIGSISPEFKRLLQQKDPRALLLLAYWYAKVSQFGIWWLSRRAILEGEAICIFLERLDQNCNEFRYLLQYPSSILCNSNSR